MPSKAQSLIQCFRNTLTITSCSHYLQSFQQDDPLNEQIKIITDSLVFPWSQAILISQKSKCSHQPVCLASSIRRSFAQIMNSGYAFDFTEICFSEALTSSEGATRSIGYCGLFLNIFHYWITLRFSSFKGIFKVTTKIT